MTEHAVPERSHEIVTRCDLKRLAQIARDDLTDFVKRLGRPSPTCDKATSISTRGLRMSGRSDESIFNLDTRFQFVADLRARRLNEAKVWRRVCSAC